MIALISSLALLLTLIYCALLLFTSRGWQRLPIVHTPVKDPSISVSILIAARNEEENIGALLNDILAQSYPRHLFEIVVIDDHSSDGTANIVASYAARGVRLLSLKADRINSYKKKAIQEGINNSAGELIITTDADCRMGPDWLRTIAGYFAEGNFHMVSAPVLYTDERSTFERLQSLEFLFLIGLGAAGIGNGVPSTCNGANLAYRRSTFLEVGGFEGIDDLASGDDELLLHKISAIHPGAIGFCKSKAAIVYTKAKPTLSDFLNQRRRWASKSTRYKNKAMIALGMGIWSFNVLILITAIGSLFISALRPVFATIMIFKILAELQIMVLLTRFAKRTHLLLLLPFLTVVHVAYMVYIGLAGNAGKYKWKGRLVR